MFICICNQVSDSQIRNLVDEGKSLEDIIFLTGASTQCGSCLDSLKDLVSKQLESRGSNEISGIHLV